MAREAVIGPPTSGVVTREEAESDPYGFRVTWIRWHSGFRGSGLQVGDRVLGLEGARYDRAAGREVRDRSFGCLFESQHWEKTGAKDGQTLTVTVNRGRELLDVTGRLLAERRWWNANERATIGPGGPEGLTNDGFDSAWSSWLEKSVEDIGSRVLDGGWRRGTVSQSRMMLADHLEQKPRVDFLVKTYPGPFAAATLADWTATRDCLQGTRYEIRPEDLAWRSLGEQRREEIAAAGKRTREAFLAKLAPETIAPFPAVDPIHGDRSKVAGKVVVLPTLTNRDWVMQSGRAWLAAGSDGDGWYFLDTTTPAFRRVSDAGWRYGLSVSPNIHETYSVIGRILPDPKMLVREGRAIPGLALEPLGVSIGDQLFVDVSQVKDGASRFAGEETLADPATTPPPEDAPPEAVMAAFFQAEKVGAEEVWKSLFASWEATIWDGEPWYKAISRPSDSTLSNEWVRCRRLLAEKVFDVRVAIVDEPRTVLQGTEFPGAPKVEQVVLETDHVGLFDSEYRAFKDVTTNRVWSLQRRDDGPWRIVTQKGI
ncbi:MAG TPA: hypothetical protein VGR51_05890 [Thermoplasmata archaeon]|jgi:hypothetical protein|nr:hypothetical protein [Thermoplasmata archaeon]